MKRSTIRIYGRVQGVSFRLFLREHMARLGLVGDATNVSDGSVEVTVEGEEEAMQQLVDACRKGPTLARVDRVEEARDLN